MEARMKAPMTFTDRLVLYRDEAQVNAPSFARDVRRGLSASPKYLPPCWLYDDLGSTLFEAITFLPEYYLTATESALLEQYGEEIIARLDGPLELLELGSGSGRKTRTLIEAITRRQDTLRYVPIDISSTALIAAASSLIETYDRIRVTAFAGDYRSAFASGLINVTNRVLALFLGSSIGNYAPEEALSLLRLVRDGLKSGDALLLGMDLKKSAGELELAYDDPLGVTACFNRNILARINRELQGNFALRDFHFVVRYDEKRGCVDSYQESVRAQRVRIADLDIEVSFAVGERIHTESSYKYDRDDIAALARESGLLLDSTWMDALERYSLNLLFVR
jgi:dimethylhistidine N-methyltransferase